MLIQACYLHDIGYSPKTPALWFPPLDGAIFAAQQRSLNRLSLLFSFHSCAYEAMKEERNPEMLAIYEKQQLRHFTNRSRPMLIQLVTYCDIQTSPTGEKRSHSRTVR